MAESKPTEQSRSCRQPDVKTAADRMAANHARLCAYADSLSETIDTLVKATRQENWSEVQRLSGQLADRSRAEGYRAVSALAQRVFDEAHPPARPQSLKRSLIRLIGTWGRIGRAPARGQ